MQLYLWFPFWPVVQSRGVVVLLASLPDFLPKECHNVCEPATIQARVR